MADHIMMLNGDVDAMLLGLATQRDYENNVVVAHYVSAVATVTSLDSFNISMKRNKTAPPEIHCKQWLSQPFRGDWEHDIHTQTKVLKYSAWRHRVWITDLPGLVLILDDEAAQYDARDVEENKVRRQMRQERMDQAYAQFARYMSRYSKVPFQPQWAETVWCHAYARRDDEGNEAVDSLSTWGNVLAGWVINPDYDWNALTASLLRQKILHIH